MHGAAPDLSPLPLRSCLCARSIDRTGGVTGFLESLYLGPTIVGLIVCTDDDVTFQGRSIYCVRNVLLLASDVEKLSRSGVHVGVKGLRS
jgi:hypothetical protein